jgi:hypothetical protein
VKKLFSALIVLLILSGFYACKKEKQFDSIPAITFKSYALREYVSGQGYFTDLKFTFTDGDGDIGLLDTETSPPYDTSSVFYYNCFIQRQKKINGVFTNVPSFNYRIPYVVPDSRNKNIEGEIIVEVFYLDDTPNVADTMRLVFYIADRALHLSNTITSEELVLN